MSTRYRGRPKTPLDATTNTGISPPQRPTSLVCTKRAATIRGVAQIAANKKSESQEMDPRDPRKSRRDFCRTAQEDENCQSIIGNESLQKVNSESSRPSGIPPRERATPNLARLP